MKIKEALPEGTVLDSGKRKYTIKSVLGQGGFGITYLASSTIQVDNIPMEMLFAIKEHYISSMNERQGASVSVSNVNNTDEVRESIDSFIVEAKRLNRLSLNHPGIVRANEDFRANGTAYYVMEYIKGQSLREYVRHSFQGRLSEDEALRLFQPIAETIGYLHENKLTHLDIKPDNILIRENGKPVIIDFGLSKHYDKKGTPTSTIKAAGCSAGYSPMEQYVGITTFTPEADIYALAATLLYMLTGKDPMVSTEINSDIIRKSLPQDISENTANAIVKAMEKLKENRTLTVAKLQKDLQEPDKIDESCINNKENHATKKIHSGHINRAHSKFLIKPQQWVIPILTFVAIIMMVVFISKKNTIKSDSNELPSNKETIFYTDYSQLQIGDYLYSDGSFSRTFNDEKDCSGIVFTLETTDMEKEQGWTHGQIISTGEDVGGENFVWGPDLDLPYPFTNYDRNVVDHQIDWMDEKRKNDARKDRNGYWYTKTILERTDSKKFELFFALKSYEHPLPNNSSGWYIPAIGQLADIVENLTNCKIEKNELFEESDESVLDCLIQKLGITRLQEEPYYTYSSSTEINNGSYWTMTFNYGTGAWRKCYPPQSGFRRAKSRPVAAF